MRLVSGIISTVVGLIFLYFVWQFVYDNFVEVRPVLDSMTEAVSQAYNWGVNKYGAAAVGGVIVAALLFITLRRR